MHLCFTIPALCIDIKLQRKMRYNLINCINKHIERLFYFTSSCHSFCGCLVWHWPFCVVVYTLGVCAGMQVTSTFLHLGSCQADCKAINGYRLCAYPVDIADRSPGRLLSIQLNQLLDSNWYTNESEKEMCPGADWMCNLMCGLWNGQQTHRQRAETFLINNINSSCFILKFN